jgi:ketosteroid isomerase-like protein
MTATDTPSTTTGHPEHPNATKVRQAHAAFKSGDMDTVRQIFDWDDIRWVLPGTSAVSGVDIGMEQVFANFGKCHAVALAHLTATRGDRTLEIDEAVIFTVGPDGRFTEAYHLAYDQYAWDAFFD